MTGTVGVCIVARYCLTSLSNPLLRLFSRTCEPLQETFILCTTLAKYYGCNS